MNAADIALLVVLGLFAVYAVLCSIEFGIALVGLFPRLATQPKRSQQLFTPLWEITNVFLVFGFIGTAVLFNGSLSLFSHHLIPELATIVLALITRAVVVLLLFYGKQTRQQQLLKWLFGLTNLVIPLSFAAAGVYALTGLQFWQTGLGWLFMSLAVFGLFTIGISFLNRIKTTVEQPFIQWLLTGLLGSWCLLVGFALPVSFAHSFSPLSNGPIAVLSLIAGVVLFSYSIVALALHKLHLTWYHSILLGLATPILLAWANRPFLISGQLTLDDSFGAQAYIHTLIIGLLVILPLLLVGFYLFGRLLIDSTASHKIATPKRRKP